MCTWKLSFASFLNLNAREWVSKSWISLMFADDGNVWKDDDSVGKFKKILYAKLMLMIMKAFMLHICTSSQNYSKYWGTFLKVYKRHKVYKCHLLFLLLFYGVVWKNNKHHNITYVITINSNCNSQTRFIAVWLPEQLFKLSFFSFFKA